MLKGARLSRLLGWGDVATLRGYSRGDVWRRYALLIGAAYLITVIACTAYFALAGPQALMPLTIPIVLLLLLFIWSLPDVENAPVRWIGRLLFAFMTAAILWPDYLAFDLPGLPWITALRLFSAPLGAVFLICLSTSSRFRSDLAERLSVMPVVHVLLIGFAGIAAGSIILSGEPVESLNKYIVAVLYWFLIFYAAVWTFTKPKTLMRLAVLIWLFAVVTCLIGLREWQMQQVVWANSIPSFLAVDDPIIQRILSAKSRAATKIYRVQSKFTTPLGFAEYLAFATPFVLYFAMFARKAATRIAAVATLPLLFLSIMRTDSRLGAVGFFMSFLLLLAAWGYLRWNRSKESVFGPAVTLAYPLIAAAFLTATFFVGRLRAMVWGTGAQSYSSQAREDQVAQGLPLVWSQPWGRGIGTAASELGYRNLAGTLTIDTYYLSVALEFGVLGFIAYYGMFLAAIAYGVRGLANAEKPEHLVLIPLMSALSIFVVVKSVFSQQENHPIVFLFLGATVACCWQIQKAKERLS